MKRELKITEQTLYNLFKIYDVMELFEEWADYDDEMKAHYLFNLLKDVRDGKYEKGNKK